MTKISKWVTITALATILIAGELLRRCLDKIVETLSIIISPFSKRKQDDTENPESKKGRDL